MRLSDLDYVRRSPSATHLMNTFIWNQQISKLDDAKLRSAYELIRIRTDRFRAKRAVNTVINAVRRAEFFGEIVNPPQLTFKITNPIQVHDFNKHMESLSINDQRVFLFSLALDIPIHEAVSLNWTQAKRMLANPDLHPVAKKILSSQVRNLHVDFVFWEYVSRFKVAPMFNAEERIVSAIGIGWMDYRENFKKMPAKIF